MPVNRIIIQLFIAVVLPVIFGRLGLVVTMLFNITLLTVHMYRLKYYYIGKVESADKEVKIGSIVLALFKNDKFIMPDENSQIVRKGKKKIMYKNNYLDVILFELKFLYTLTIVSTLGIIIMFYI